MLFLAPEHHRWRRDRYDVVGSHQRRRDSLQYQFWRLDADGWHMVQDYCSMNSYTWKPTLADVGPHSIQVWIRNAGSTALLGLARHVVRRHRPLIPGFTLAIPSQAAEETSS
jgi:hypothetical protein